jgi:hypothetical protein
MKNHGLIRVDKTFLMQIRMEQAKREKKEREEQEQKDKLKTQPRPLWRSDWNK